MKNNQINFFKSGDFNTVLKPLQEDLKTFREERIVKIEKYGYLKKRSMKNNQINFFRSRDFNTVLKSPDLKKLIWLFFMNFFL